MKKKINRQLIFMSVLTILTFAICMTAVFYDLTSKQVEKDLKTEADVIQSAVSSNLEGYQNFSSVSDEIRVTLIQKDGKVLYDNDADIHTMENHKNRPEIKNALKYHVGQSVRRSHTLNKSTYYYAVELSDGNILRVAKEADNVWSIIQSILMIMALICVIMIIASVLFAHLFTKNMIKPIEMMVANVENYNYQPAYKELVPFVEMIRQQHNDILKSVKVRQEFTANVSHELKTPLTSISGYAEIMENGMADENEVQHFSAEIHKNAIRLLKLINDIIRLSQLDETDALQKMEKVDLKKEIGNCVMGLSINAQKQNVKIVCQTQTCLIFANREMIQEVIINLCSNAIRYNKPGGKMFVSCFYRDNQAVLSVRDTGIGIPKEHQKRVFERFYRVDKSRSKETGGTGLGLSIVKHIVALNEGKIYLESEPGKGTVVEISFPMLNR